MKYHPLGHSNLSVSELCLGTMTFASQTTIQEAHQQLNYAVSQGINFIDTAELYPLPGNAETQGNSESAIGQWLVNQPRDQLIIASKVAGAGPRFPWIRGKNRRVDRTNIEQAINESLRRLQTDYIDLYYIHWPDRYVPVFGEIHYNPSHERETVPIAEQLEVFSDLVKAGKIRYVGLSNETPWGVCEFCRVAKELKLPKVVAIQNAYNLTNRIFEIYLSESCRFHKLGLLAYSPLAFGHLTGKYMQTIPQKSRLKLFPGFDQRYQKPNFEKAVSAYVKIAQKFALTPLQMALAFVRSRWFVTSTIIGCSSLEQLQENINTIEIQISQEIIAEINAVHSIYPNPTP
ncbi:MAG: aldo/keto reductase [Roseofilum sp. SBFL]|uniref:aldo/keto reductase n=1 Tax=unclassified Roseofilum TaxID=2620099 RepID=UPI001B134509|nr:MULTISPECIES: aldo/keto reductase [unclassified Roseofilum]MBP0013931.1 aldo/keto reductase [Roseofilum sp. SID3]MBP0023628.1 aldo/keto reductase [Roseofilum sp. SID2]MBP0038966.1 aldo/keto reductase [Roseofilum sp. SID1]MBP0041765.1 aldo/keto reductase [Roseofilum sp. SBFL]